MTDNTWKEVDPATLTEEEKAQAEANACNATTDPPSDDPHREQGPHYSVGEVLGTLKHMLAKGMIKQEQYDKAVTLIVESQIMQRDMK